MEHNDTIFKLLEQAKKKGESAEVFYLSRYREPIVFEANKLKTLELQETSGVSLRLIKNGRIGFSSTNVIHEPNTLIENAIETAPFGPIPMFEFPNFRVFNPVQTNDPATKSFPIARMIDLGQDLVEKIRELNPEVLCDCEISKNVTTIIIANTNGGFATYTTSVFAISINGTLIDGTDMFFVGDYTLGCKPIENTDELVSSVSTQLENGKVISDPVNGQVDAIFTPRGVASAIIPPLMSGFNGKSVLQGSSPLADKLDKIVFDKKIRIWDHPDQHMIPGSRMCDDEGVSSKRMPLIDNGVVRNFLYDLQTAGQSNKESTGNAHRSLSSPPSPGISVSVVYPGDTSFQDMVANTKHGIIVEGLLGAGQSNILGGDINANVLLGYRIKNGEIVGRLKNTIINGNVYQALKNIKALGNDSKWIGGSLRTPSIYCSGISAATRE